MSENIAALLTDRARRDAERVALRLDDVALSYAALDGAAARVAGLLAAHDVGVGDRVGIMLPNVPYFPVVYYAVLRRGGVVVPMNPLLKAREVEFHLADSGARLLFAWHDFAQAARDGAQRAGAECLPVKPGEFEGVVGSSDPLDDVAERAGSDTAVILYTSGTTGTPKGAELTHANLGSNARIVATTLADSGPEDVVLGALPLFHSFGQTCGLNATVLAGACLTLIPRFDAARALQIVERDRVTIFEGVPTMFAAMLAAPASRTPPACGCASPEARRCPARSCAASTSASTPRSWRATVCRRPRRWPRSPIPSASASRGRSARRSPGWR